MFAMEASSAGSCSKESSGSNSRFERCAERVSQLRPALLFWQRKIPHRARFSATRQPYITEVPVIWDSGVGMTLAFQQGMKSRRPLHLTSSMVVLSILCTQTLGANTPINVDVDRGNDKAYVVGAAFDVNVPAPIAWEVLTDYEGIGRFVSSIRQSTIKHREAGRLLLEQHGVGRAWIISLPMHVVLDVREHDQRVLAFHDVCGKSFSVYEGSWELSENNGRTRVTYRLKADPTGRQPAMLAKSAIKGSVKTLLDEVRKEMVARGAR